MPEMLRFWLLLLRLMFSPTRMWLPRFCRESVHLLLTKKSTYHLLSKNDNLTSFRRVREQANKTLEIFLQRVRKYAETLPETMQIEPGMAQTKSNRQAALQNKSS